MAPDPAKPSAAGGGEAAKVSDLSHQHYGGQERDAAHRLQGGDHRCQRPVRYQLADLLAQAIATALGLVDRIDLLLQHDLLGWVLEAEPDQPAPVRRRPRLTTHEHPTVAQEEALQLLPGPTDRLHRRR